jgi:ubiquinone biosynthesis protein
VREARLRPRSESAEQGALERLHERGAERIYRLCVELRGGVLKLGQLASSRMDLLPHAYVAALSRLQDRVPPVSREHMAARLRDELGAPPREVFAAFEDEPLAAASLAQVHAARLADGTEVAVKALVPGIEEIVAADLAALRIAVPALGDLLAWVDLATVVDELERTLNSELDYAGEARHAAAFAACFAGDDEIVVPRVHLERSTRRVLVMDRIHGERLTDYLDRCEARGAEGEADRDRIVSILLRAFCDQVLHHGLMQADPHPGNFLVVEGGDGPRLALLDFGCVRAYPPERRRAYADLALSVLAGSPARTAELLAAAGFSSRDGHPAALHVFAEMMLEAFRENATFDASAIDPGARLERFLELTRENPIAAIPEDFVLLARVFAALGGLLLRYRPRVNLFQILVPRLAAAAA